MTSARANNFTPNEVILAASLELSSNSWKIALQDGQHLKPSIHSLNDEAAEARFLHVLTLIEEHRAAWGLEKTTPVVVSYEAGQDGFWIARELERHGYTALVVDPASIPVGRQARRAKTDRLDVIRLVNCLRAWLRGERDQMRVVVVPSPEDEDQRHGARDRGQLQKEIGQHRDRIRKLLRTQGCWDPVDATFAQRLADGEVRCAGGKAPPPQLAKRLERELKRLAQAEEQLAGVEKELAEKLPEPVLERIAHLKRLKGVGQVGATRLVLELFWRRFENRRQVGACVGLVPQPYDSGESRVDQGISKQGNRRVRALLIEMAWMWLRYQPDSTLAKWFASRTGGGGPNKRGKRIAIVAVARRLVIALWRYLETGAVPEGALFKRV
jgi:transposase